MSYENSYDDKASVRLTNIVPTEGTELSFEQIDFSPYNNPNVAVDSAARYAAHEIIGGTTVRQKIGEEPTEVSIDGVCTERVAKRVDELRKVSYLDVIGGRFASGITCQVGSTSTEPLEDGGAADIDSGDFLYDYNINLVEISPNELQQSGDEDMVGGGGGFLQR